ncbi:MAG: Mth938-like domain-containing protein [Gammaproteobacteria bacterium]|nr:Mth938-like domain-containing protein [Gammaproteobacteria bacterium]
MKIPLILDENQANYQIRGFEPGRIQINDAIYTASLIVAPNQLITNWPPSSVAELKKEHLDIIIPLEPTILLIGTGSNLVFPPLNLYGHFINLGIGVEIMHTAAASRTYNALTAENRKVVAALMLR